MSILLVDNFDSFTYNLYQYLAEVAGSDVKIEIFRNNEIPFSRVSAGDFSHIVISPGPGSPEDVAYFGGCSQLIEQFYKTYPILGVCLGHQGIGAYFGAKIIKAPVVMHGKTSTFSHSAQGLFRGLPGPVTAMRYHSLILDTPTFPSCLRVDAETDDGVIMAFHHQNYPVFGLQFHPESFATPTGKSLLSNFLM